MKINRTLLLLIIAIAISFIGSIPPGTTNIVTLQLAATGIVPAILFAGGCLCGEMIYVSLCVFMTDRLLRLQKILKVLGWICLLVLVALAIASFAAALSDRPVSAATEVSDDAPFIAGLLLMLINPVQIPFWLGWTAILAEKNILLPRNDNYIAYVAGSGIGSLLASILFIVFGDFLAGNSWITHRAFHWVVGAFFLLSAAFQLRNVLKKL